jgi:uncharacterized membrane protein
MTHPNALLNGHGRPSASPLYDSSNILNVSRQGRIASIVAGSLLTSNAMGQLSRHPIRGLLKLAIGGYLLYRGLSGNCPVSAAIEERRNRHTRAVNIRTKLLIAKPREEVYAFWRQLGNLPLFMQHLVKVDEKDGIHSHWVARGPGGIGTIEWEAEIMKEEPGRLLGWRSVANSMIATAGRVSFEDAANGGTFVEVMITYRPPAGHVGTGLAWLLNLAFERMIENDINRVKDFLESGELIFDDEQQEES